MVIFNVFINLLRLLAWVLIFGFAGLFLIGLVVTLFLGE